MLANGEGTVFQRENGSWCAQVTLSKVLIKGSVIGVDFSDAMLARARDAAIEVGADNVDFHHADAEQLPFEDGALDVVCGQRYLQPQSREERYLH